MQNCNAAVDTSCENRAAHLDFSRSYAKNDVHEDRAMHIRGVLQVSNTKEARTVPTPNSRKAIMAGKR